MYIYPKKEYQEVIAPYDGNNLEGTIPEELGALASLTQLNLSGNKLSGTIPSTLYALTNLEFVKLEGSGNSKVKGTIPCIKAIFTLGFNCDIVTCNCSKNCECTN